MDLLNDSQVELIILNGINHVEIPKYLNSADVLLVTSLWEGSPNIIKEAMACNCPIVSTNVGDVEWVIGNTEGCYLTTFNPQDVAKKIKLALQYAKEKGRTRGRDRIIELGLESEIVARKLINVYEGVLDKRR